MNCTRIFAVALCALLSACVEAPIKPTAPAEPAKAIPSAVPPAPDAPPAPIPPPTAAPTLADKPPAANIAPPSVGAAPRPTPTPSTAAKPAVAAAPLKPAAPASGVTAPKKASPPTVAATPPVAATASSTGATIAGSLAVIAGTAQRVEPNEVAEAVVYFVPDAGARHPKAGQFQIYTRDKQFDPTSAVVPLGSTINFPNKDEVLHNVFSASPGAEFDLGLFGEGKSAAYTFARRGVVTVHCNVHPLMQVSVLVVDTPYFTHPSSSGEFQLAGLPAGPGKLFVWHPRAGMQTYPLLSSATSGLALQITLSKPRVAPHLNKERKPYQTAMSK